MCTRRFIVLIGILYGLFSGEIAAQERTVSGVVSDKTTGKALPGVNILLRGTIQGTVTDQGGAYSLSVPADTAVLVFSYLGYAIKEMPVYDRTIIDVQLSPSAIDLDEVVFIGYGTQRRGNITGAISSVPSKDIMEIPVTDLGSAIQGRATGVLVLSDGNQPGQKSVIRIRGRRSLSASNAPLIIVDGISLDGYNKNISLWNIKSVEILKDASATAIYGARGSNGVILITTHRGGDMPTKVNYSGYYGIISVLGRPDMMNGEEFYRMKEISGLSFSQEELDAYAAGVSTDWVDLVLDNGHRQNHHLGIRGGNKRTGFAISTNLFNEKGVISIQDYTRYSFHINLDHKISERIRFGTSTEVASSVQNWATSPYRMALFISPLAEPYDTNGNMVWLPGGVPHHWNPLADFIEGNLVDEYTASRVNTNIYAEGDILKNLTYRLNFGPDFWCGRRGFFRGTNSMNRQGGHPRAQKGHLERFDYTFENILTYKQKWQVHDLEITGLFSAERWREESTIIDTETVPYESQLFHNLGTAETILSMSSHLEEFGLMSFMARLNYGLKNRYMLTLTGRFDGSSRLAEGKKWGFFPSAAVMWRISGEQFMAGQTMVSDLRLRASYGITGNTAIQPYQTRGYLTRTSYAFDGEEGFGYRPDVLANPDLTWESSAMVNLGLDFGFWEQRIRGTVEIYRTRTYDLLLRREIPPTSGFSWIYDNIGETLNRGWEASLAAKSLSAGNFIWETSLELSGNREEIVDLYGTMTDDVGNLWFIGQPTTVWYDYEKLGIWQTDEEEEASAYGFKPGQIKVRDVNEDGMINQADRVVLGSDMPELTVGLGSRFAYRGLDLSFLVIGAFGHTVTNSFEVGNASLNGRSNCLDVDYWTETNPTNAHPKPDGHLSEPLFSTSRAYYPGDFVKIRNIQLGYSLPEPALARIRIKKLRLYVNFDTPFVWSHLADNFDPEVYRGLVGKRWYSKGHGSDVPPIRMVSIGLMLDF